MSAPKAAIEIEAILLVSGRPVPVRTLVSATERPKDEVEAALALLEERFSPETSGIVLRRVANGYQLATNPAVAASVENFRKEARPSPLSSAAYEVLSCVLYLGPITRAGISRVRGVNSDAVARSLIERGLLFESGVEADLPGTPALLDLTEDFHIASSSSNRADFPPLESLVSDEELERVRERVGVENTASTDSTPETPQTEELEHSEEPDESEARR